MISLIRCLEGLRLIENLEISFDVAASRKDGGTSLDLSEVAEAIEAALERVERGDSLKGIAHFDHQFMIN